MTQSDDGGGFLSLLGRIFRLSAPKSADRRADTDVVDAKAVLQSLIDRKRRNDFVRQREFDVLRKIRTQVRLQADAIDCRPSMLQGTQPSRIDDRASTIQKINAIEAQMSSQWMHLSILSGETNTHGADMGTASCSHGQSSADFFNTPAQGPFSELFGPQQMPCDERERSVWSVQAVWTAPPWVDAPAVSSLQHVLSWAPQPWVLDWSELTTLDVKAARALLGLFSLWADQSVQLRFVGDDVLRQRLMALTPSGRRDVEQLWWELRMTVLRVMNRPAEFEQVARDCCVLHELPRMLWEPPRCKCLSAAIS